MANLPDVVSREEWLTARKDLLAKEKDLTRARDRVNADRRRLPMVRVDKPYSFEGPDGTVTLLDMFQGRPQLVMHHFMFGPDWDEGCPSCSSAADGIGTAAAAARAQHHAGRRVARAVPEARRVPGADGLDVSLVFLVRHGLQLRLPRHPRRPGRAGAAALPDGGRARRDRHSVDGRAVDGDHARRGDAGHQRVPAGRRRGVPHVLHVRPRHRGVPQRLPVPRSHRSRSPGGVGGAAGTRGSARHAGRRPQPAVPDEYES